jgi:adenylate cyclase
LTSAEGERRLAAIMYTDMVGYTALGQRNESLSLALVEEQRKLIRPILARHNGREIKTIGDAFLVEFPNALDAVRCAYDIQRATREFNVSLPTEKRIHLRIGLHLGDVVESKGDIAGDAVNVASRIEPLAEDGGVCLTHQVYESTHSKFDMRLVSIGMKPLKNVAEPMEVYRMEMPWEQTQPTLTSQFDRRRVAVLPFVSMSPDAGDEYFADGMTEELITSLSRMSGLKVIARTSVMRYKGHQKSISEVAKELEVGTILEGSVRKAGDRVRITAQLIDTATSEHMWSETYDRNLENVFDIQRDVSRSIADFLKVSVMRTEREGLETKDPKTVSAYLSYLKGRALLAKRKPEEMKEAKEMFEASIREDPSYASSYVALASTYMLMGGSLHDFGISPGQAKGEARALAAKAAALDPNLAEVHTVLAMVLESEYRFAEAEAEYRKALSLNPNEADSHYWFAFLLVGTGRLQEALQEYELAERLDPLTIPILTNKAVALICAGREAEAAKCLERAAKMDEESINVLDIRGHFECYRGNYSKAEKDWKKMEERMISEGEYMPGNPDLATLYWLTGDREKAMECVGKVRAMPESTEHQRQNKQFLLACAYAAVCDSESFFPVAENLIEEKQITFSLLRTLHLAYPPSRGLKDDPRWAALFRKVGLEP